MQYKIYYVPCGSQPQGQVKVDDVQSGQHSATLSANDFLFFLSANLFNVFITIVSFLILLTSI